MGYDYTTGEYTPDDPTPAVDPFIAQNQSQGESTFGGLGETFTGALGTLGDWASKGVAVYKSVTGSPAGTQQGTVGTAANKTKSTSALTNFPLAGGGAKNLWILAGAAVALLLGGFLLLRRKG